MTCNEYCFYLPVERVLVGKSSIAIARMKPWHCRRSHGLFQSSKQLRYSKDDLTLWNIFSSFWFASPAKVPLVLFGWAAPPTESRHHRPSCRELCAAFTLFFVHCRCLAQNAEIKQILDVRVRTHLTPELGLDVLPVGELVQHRPDVKKKKEKANSAQHV